MALKNESVKDMRTVCINCGTPLNIQVLSSTAGFYIGFHCSHCGPYSRESGYYPSWEEATVALTKGVFIR